MTSEAGEADNPTSSGKNFRLRLQLSPGGKRYLARCELAGKSQGDLFRFVHDNYREHFSSVDHYIRDGVSAPMRVRAILVEFLEGTEFPITPLWFNFSWHPYAVLDSFQRFTNLSSDFCGVFKHIFPASPDPISGRRYADILSSRSFFIEPDTAGVLKWEQSKDGDPGKPLASGFGLHDKDTAFLTGVNRKRDVISYFILKKAPAHLAQEGVRLLGLQAGTHPLGPPNGAGVAKRTVLVSPDRWLEWEDGTSCPEVVRSWLLSEGHGIFADLVTERHEDDELNC